MRGAEWASALITANRVVAKEKKETRQRTPPPIEKPSGVINRIKIFFPRRTNEVNWEKYVR